MKTEKTYVDTPAQVKRVWYVIDLADQCLGRAATRMATLLRGKHKPTYTPHIDGGDFVIAINADKVSLSGKKWTDKMYYRHSGYPGGLKSMNAAQLRARRPERMVELAVGGMLPKGPLGRAQLKKLKVYAGGNHPHVAQQPQVWSL